MDGKSTGKIFSVIFTFHGQRTKDLLGIDAKTVVEKLFFIVQKYAVPFLQILRNQLCIGGQIGNAVSIDEMFLQVFMEQSFDPRVSRLGSHNPGHWTAWPFEPGKSSVPQKVIKGLQDLDIAVQINSSVMV